jgi:hypothetical protein
LFKAKEGENFNHPSTIYRTYGAGRNTLSILRINPPKFGGGLKFEPDAGIVQKGAFCKGLKRSSVNGRLGYESNFDGVVKSPIYCVVVFLQTLGILLVWPRS